MATKSYPNPNPSIPSVSAAAASDVSALLIEVLRNVNREVQTNLTLDGKALAAVRRFQALSRDLRTLADGPSATFGNSPSLRGS